MFALERDANAIGQQTRRGKGNIIICSADVASALQMAGWTVEAVELLPELAAIVDGGLIEDFDDDPA